MPRLLTTMIPLLALCATGAWALENSPRPELDANVGTLDLSVENPKGDLTTIHVAPDPNGVRIDYVVIEGAQRIRQSRHFEKPVLDSIRKRWGSGSFDLTGWPSETGCQQTMVWVVRTGHDSRVLCRDERRVHRLADFQSMIQLIMQTTILLPSEEPKIEDVTTPKNSGATGDSRSKSPAKAAPDAPRDLN